jgi:hypothetical protein
MSKAVPHFSPEWLEEYNKRLSVMQQKAPAPKAQKPQESPHVARPESKPALVPYSATESVAVPFRAAEGKQSKTEQKYNREVLGGRGRFEPICLYLPGGGRYTPDFMTVDDGVITFHEVKGSYRLGSQGRAYTAFHEAAAYFPMWRFVWAHWTGKDWDCKTVAEINL